MRDDNLVAQAGHVKRQSRNRGARHRCGSGDRPSPPARRINAAIGVSAATP
jgi:hypothetical protein